MKGTLDPTLRALLDALFVIDPAETVPFLVAADRAQEIGALTTEWILRCLADTNPVDRLRTGSRAYGIPTEDSDWDWVLRLYPGESGGGHALLRNHCDRARSSGKRVPAYLGDVPYRLSGSYRFGSINVITVDTEPQMSVWREGAAFLLAESGLHGPRTRDRAIEVFTRLSKRPAVL